MNTVPYGFRAARALGMVSMVPPDVLDAARLLRPVSGWERRFHEYELLLTAGVDADEAARIVSDLHGGIFVQGSPDA